MKVSMDGRIELKKYCVSSLISIDHVLVFKKERFDSSRLKGFGGHWICLGY